MAQFRVLFRWPGKWSRVFNVVGDPSDYWLLLKDHQAGINMAFEMTPVKWRELISGFPVTLTGSQTVQRTNPI